MSMYLEHFGLTEAPFKITAHTQFFFTGANRGETLQALTYAITSGEGMVKVTGEVGAGKTMLCRVLMERLPDTVETIYLAVPSLSRDEMLVVVSEDLGIDTRSASTTKLIRALQEKLVAIHAEGKQVVALIDEAHAMPLETLEEIRLLSNLETSHHKLMQIVLFGQPELDQHLMLPKMRQLKERITHSFHLQPLPEHQINDYLNFRLRAAGYKGPNLFSKDAIELIADASEGLTRRINIYADKTLLAAYAEDTHTVTADHVRAAIADTQIILTPSRKYVNLDWPALIAAMAVGLIIGSGIGYLGGRMNAPKAAAPLVTGTITQAAPDPARAAPIALTPPVSAAPAATSAPNAAAPAPKTPPPATAGAVAPAPKVAVPAPPATPIAPPVAASSAAKVPTKESAKLAAAQVTPAQVTPAFSATVESAKLPSAALRAPAGLLTGPLADRMREGAKRINSLPPEHYVIQLMTADARRRVEVDDFLRVAGRELDGDRLALYPVGSPENPRVMVILASFADRAEAVAEISAMSDRVKKFKPYLRTVRALREGN